MKPRARVCPWCRAPVVFTGTAQYEKIESAVFAVNIQGEIARLEAGYVRHGCTQEHARTCDD